MTLPNRPLPLAKLTGAGRSSVVPVLAQCATTEPLENLRKLERSARAEIKLRRRSLATLNL